MIKFTARKPGLVLPTCSNVSEHEARTQLTHQSRRCILLKCEADGVGASDGVEASERSGGLIGILK